MRPETTMPELLTDRAVAELLGMSRATLWKLSRLGQLPRPVKIGNMTRWRRDEVYGVIDAVTSARDANVAGEGSL
jgi:predicted DNA-binding transcriptional regulator AlpA